MSIRRHPSEREVPAAPKTRLVSALREKPEARWFLAGNALWTGSVDGLRPYFFLFATTVVGITIAEASLLLVLLVVGLGAGSALLGGLGDRANRGRLLQYGLVATGIAMVAGVAVREPMSAFLLLLIAGGGAAAVITLPFPVYAELVGVEAMGRSTSFYVISLGAGRLIAPIMVGAAIDLGSAWFPAERGYPLMWPVSGAMMLAGAFALHRALETSAPRVERLRGARPGSVGA
jgi:MFS family permease